MVRITSFDYAYFHHFIACPCQLDCPDGCNDCRNPICFCDVWFTIIKTFLTSLLRVNWTIKMKWILNRVWEITVKFLETAFSTVEMTISVRTSVLSISKMIINFVHVRYYSYRMTHTVWLIPFELNRMNQHMICYISKDLSCNIDELSKWLSMFWFWLQSTREIYFDLEYLRTW